VYFSPSPANGGASGGQTASLGGTPARIAGATPSGSTPLRLLQTPAPSGESSQTPARLAQTPAPSPLSSGSPQAQLPQTPAGGSSPGRLQQTPTTAVTAARLSATPALTNLVESTSIAGGNLLYYKKVVSFLFVSDKIVTSN